MKFRGKQVLIAFDQLLNALLRGWADETLSARAWRCRDRAFWGVARAVIDGLFFFEPNHCYQAYVGERARMQLPPEYRA